MTDGPWPFDLMEAKSLSIEIEGWVRRYGEEARQRALFLTARKPHSLAVCMEQVAWEQSIPEPIRSRILSLQPDDYDFGSARLAFATGLLYEGGRMKLEVIAPAAASTVRMLLRFQAPPRTYRRKPARARRRKYRGRHGRG